MFTCQLNLGEQPPYYMSIEVTQEWTPLHCADKSLFVTHLSFLRYRSSALARSIQTIGHNLIWLSCCHYSLRINTRSDRCSKLQTNRSIQKSIKFISSENCARVSLASIKPPGTCMHTQFSWRSFKLVRSIRSLRQASTATFIKIRVFWCVI